MPVAAKAMGRLGDPKSSLETDPRTHPVMLQLLKTIGLAANSEFPYPDPNAPVESLEPVVAGMQAGFEGLYNALPNDLPGDEKEKPVDDYETISIDSAAGHKINLYVFRPATSGPSPAVIYNHGGGMTILTTKNKVHMRWCADLARHGVVAILVDFRNAWAEGGKRIAYPGPLDDCVAAAKYVHAHRSELGITKLVLQGESGGANLSLAVALRANRDGWIEAIDGVSGQCPYISGPAFAWSDDEKLEKLPSLLECDGHLLQCANMIATARWYHDGEDPIAWPYFANTADLKGLPPHHITVAELDPLKSEGMAYHYKLLAAGVRSTASVSLGLVHAASLFLRQALPDEHFKEIRDIVAFAQTL